MSIPEECSWLSIDYWKFQEKWFMPELNSEFEQVNKNKTHRDVNGSSMQEDDMVPNFYHLAILSTELKVWLEGSKFWNKMKELLLWKAFHRKLLFYNSNHCCLIIM